MPLRVNSKRLSELAEMFLPCLVTTLYKSIESFSIHTHFSSGSLEYLGLPSYSWAEAGYILDSLPVH